MLENRLVSSEFDVQPLNRSGEVNAVIGLIAVPQPFEHPSALAVVALFDARHEKRLSIICRAFEINPYLKATDQKLIGRNFSNYHAACNRRITLGLLHAELRPAVG